MSIFDFSYISAAALLPPRKLDMHKGNRGKLLVAGGSPHYPGAPALSVLAALRSGCGVVTLLSSPEVCYACAARLPEAVYLPSSDGWAEAAVNALPVSDSAVAGPGLGRSDKAMDFTRKIWNSWTKPILLDGDALFALSGQPESVFPKRDNSVITPHEAEAARLLGLTAEQVRSDRLSAIKNLSGRWGCVLLKGNKTLVTSCGEIYCMDFGGPELSVPGSGDVLSGSIGAFLAMGMSPLDSALLGGALHGLAGLRLNERYGVDGILASEIADEIPFVIRELRGADLS